MKLYLRLASTQNLSLRLPSNCVQGQPRRGGQGGGVGGEWAQTTTSDWKPRSIVSDCELVASPFIFAHACSSHWELMHEMEPERPDGIGSLWPLMSAPVALRTDLFLS